MRVAGILLAFGLLAMPAVAQARIEARPLTIQHDRLPGMCLTLSGPGGASVNAPCDGSAGQKFILPGPEGGPIRQGEACLVPRGAGHYPQLYAEACDGSPAQTWTMNAERELRNGAGRCLTLMGSVSVTGTTIFAAECPKEGAAHQWRATHVDFTNMIEASLESSVRPGECIGYDTQLKLYPCSDAYGQIISFDVKALGQLRLKGSCISGGNAFSGVSLGSCYDMPTQKWVILPDGAVANSHAECIEVVNEDGHDVLRTTVCGGKAEQHWIVRMPPRTAN